ncbi:MAG: ABC transporter ATP-binding protein [Alphaproteobacteria bacterium]|nr:ABC transporter ATP-binding protein [Alphaproteobacteria bacterium]
MTPKDLRAATDPPPPAISLGAICKSFADGPGAATEALRDVSLEIAEGTFVSLLGPSGCGKTTVLRILDGLLAPGSGRAEVFGAPPAPGPRTGFVFQSFRLIPWETVTGNVAFALASLPLGKAERAERARHYIDLVGLGRFADAYPRQLSGGMRQRAALARAMACEPRLLLMDEPFASLDAQTRELMQIELMRLWSMRRTVVVFVTHSVDEALFLSDRIILMGPRPGRVVETIEVPLPRPRWTYDVRAEPAFVGLRSHLARRMQELVLNDPHSEFFGRDLGAVRSDA